MTWADCGVPRTDGDQTESRSELSPDGFECVILSDLVWCDTHPLQASLTGAPRLSDSHVDLIEDVRRTLARTDTARALIFGGRYTAQRHIEGFRRKLGEAGLVSDMIDLELLLGPAWTGTTDVEGLPFEPGQTVGEAMLVRRRACWAMEARWRM